jgi:hypothetical protein
VRLLVQPLVHRRGGILVVAVSDRCRDEYWYLSLQDGRSVDLKRYNTKEACDYMFMRAMDLSDRDGDGEWLSHQKPQTMVVMPPPYTTEAHGPWVQQVLIPTHMRVLAAVTPNIATATGASR